MLWFVSTPGLVGFCLDPMAQGKLHIYDVLVKHYSHTDRPALLPSYLSDVYTAIIDLLGKM